MRHLTLTGILLIAFSLLLTGCQTGSSADDDSTINADDITIDGAWVRAMESGNSAAYMTITNNSNTDITLTDASAEFAGMVQVHQTTIENDVARMQQVENGLSIPAGETITLEPGGYHIMLMNLTDALIEGNDTDITLTFDSSISRTVTTPIRTEAPQD